MKKWPLFFPFAVVLGIVFCATSCKKTGADAADAKVIKVGEYSSLTGKDASFGRSSHKGTQLAVDEVNARGGVLGKQIELICDDNQSKAGESSIIAQKLISRDKVVGVLGEVSSGRSLEAAAICQQYKVPMISPSSTNPKVTAVGDYIFRVCFTDPFQGKLIADFVKDSLKANKAAVLIDVGNAYSVGLAAYFEEPFKAGGGTIVGEQKYNGGDKDFKAQLTTVKGENPDVLVVPGYYSEAGLIAQQARQLGITIPIVGGDGWEAPELIEIGKEAMANTYFSTHYSSENQSPLVQSFVKNFMAKNGGEVPDAEAACGYDSAMVLLNAIQSAGTTDGAKLRDAIAATKDYDGVSGKTTINATRDATKSAVIITVENGKFKYLKTVNP